MLTDENARPEADPIAAIDRQLEALRPDAARIELARMREMLNRLDRMVADLRAWGVV